VDLCRRYGVRRLDVFGSAARGADFDVATSDVDFLVQFGPPGDDLARFSI
jgi:predicted nucleotidyltransferase